VNRWAAAGGKVVTSGPKKQWNFAAGANLDIEGGKDDE
jgi:hypothetical protein